jgi:hypothetical protein
MAMHREAAAPHGQRLAGQRLWSAKVEVMPLSECTTFVR